MEISTELNMQTERKTALEVLKFEAKDLERRIQNVVVNVVQNSDEGWTGTPSESQQQEIDRLRDKYYDELKSIRTAMRIVQFG